MNPDKAFQDFHDNVLAPMKTNKTIGPDAVKSLIEAIQLGYQAGYRKGAMDALTEAHKTSVLEASTNLEEILTHDS